MSPDDPRHSTYAGYQAGCAEACCTEAAYKARKEADLYRFRHGSCRVTNAQLIEAISPWVRMGLSPSAIQKAAGTGANIPRRLRLGSGVNREAYAAILAITEDDLPATARIYADLTRQRVGSLMVAGHRLIDMPLRGYDGRWRTASYLSVSTTRTIRDYYALREFQLGGSEQTASKARQNGYLPPLAWDDPGTLAWPNGKPERLPTRLRRERRKPRIEIDPAVVQRVLNGDARIVSNQAERIEVTRRWGETGRSLNDLARLTGWKADRYRSDALEGVTPEALHLPQKEAAQS